MFGLRSVPILSNVVVTFLSSVVLNFWVVPLLHSVNDMSMSSLKVLFCQWYTVQKIYGSSPAVYSNEASKTCYVKA